MSSSSSRGAPLGGGGGAAGHHPGLAEAADLTESLRHDLVLAPFFDFSFNAEAYVRSVIRSDYDSPATSGLEESAAEQALARIRQKSVEVEQAIKALVSTHQDALFAQAGNTAALKRKIGSVSERVGGMQSMSSRLHEDVVGPYFELKKEAQTLQHVLTVSDIMRRVQRLHFNLRRLRGLTVQAPAGSSSSSGSPRAGGSSVSEAPATAVATSAAVAPEKLADIRSLTRIAPLLHEVEQDLSEGSVEGVAVIDAERPFVAGVSSAVRDAVRAMLVRSADSLNTADVSASLAVFHELHCVPEEVVAAVDRAAAIGAAAIREALDVRRVATAAHSAIDGSGGGGGKAGAGAGGGGGSGISGGVGMGIVGMSMTSLLPGQASRGAGGGAAALLPPAGAAAAWRGALWGRVESLCETLQRLTLQIWHLLYIVSRTRDAAAAAAAAGASRKDTMVASIAKALALAGKPGGIGPNPGEAAGPPEGIITAAGPSAEGGLEGGGGSRLGGPGHHHHDGNGGGTHPAVRLMLRFWHVLAGSLASEILALTSGDASGFVRNALVDGYPRLHYLLLETVVARAGKSVSLRASDDEGSGAGTGSGGRHAGGGADTPSSSNSAPLSGSSLFLEACSPRALVWAVAPLFRLYLARSLSRMTEPLGPMFPPNQPRPRLAGEVTPSGLTPAGFTPLPEADRWMDESFPSPPPLAAVQAFCRALAGELGACKPAAVSAAAALLLPRSAGSSSTTGGGQGGFPGSGISSGGGPGSAAVVPGLVHAGTGPSGVLLDPALYAAVAKGVSTSVRMLVGKAEEALGPSASSGGAACVAEHWMPLPAQTLNLGTVGRLDDIRRAIVRAAGEVPSPPALERLLSAGESDPVVRMLAGRRTEATPLRLPLSPALLIVDHLLCGGGRRPGSGSGEGEGGRPTGGGSGPPPNGPSSAEQAHAELVAAARSCAAGYLLEALSAVEALIEDVVSPWLAALALPLERSLLRMHDLTYSSSASSSASPSSSSGGTGAAAVDGGEQGTGAAVGADSGALLGESDYIRAMESHTAALSRHQLALLPAGHLTDVIRGALASRLLVLFVRFACLLRPVDESGKLRLTRDASQLESGVLPPLWSDVPRLGRAYAELRALRPFLFMASADLLAAVAAAAEGSPAAPGAADNARQRKIVTLLRSLGTANVLPALAARLPRECPLPHQITPPAAGATATTGALAAYEQWLDAVAVGAALGGAGGTPAGEPPTGPAAAAAASQVQLPPWVPPAVASSMRLFPAGDRASAALDAAVLRRVQDCVEAFVQRAAEGSAHAEFALLTTHVTALVQRATRR